MCLMEFTNTAAMARRIAETADNMRKELGNRDNKSLCEKYFSLG